MATSLLSPNAKQKFDTLAGAPAAGYRLYTYAAGTTTPQATYSNRAGTVANTNPIILDARGECVVYLTPGLVYDYKLTTAADVLEWTQPGVSADAGDAAAVYFTDTLATAYLKTTSDIINGSEVGLLRFIDRTKHSAILDGTSTADVRTDLQTAVDSAAVGLVAPRGKYIVNGTVTVGTAPISIRGQQAGSAGSRFHQQANVPTFQFNGQGTLRDVGLIGTNNAAHTNQQGVFINNVNGVDLFGVVFDANYDSLKVFDLSHYLRFDKLRFFNCIKRHIYGTGTAAGGYQFDLTNSLVTATTGETAFQFENAGSITFNNVIATPANMTERCFHLISNATQAGLHMLVNSVFESSVKEALRIEGASAAAPIKFLHVSNCYMNQSGAGQDAVTLINTRDVSFDNCYLSGTGSALTIAGTTRDTKLSNCEFQVSGATPVIRTLAGGKVAGLHVVNPTYAGSQRLVDLSASAAADLSKLHVFGGDWGTHAAPINLPAACGAKIRTSAVGQTQTRNGGIATFSGTGAVSLYQVAHGMLDVPAKFGVTPNSIDAGTAEIREVTVDATNVNIQLKASAVSGTNNVKFAWWAET